MRHLISTHLDFNFLRQGLSLHLEVTILPRLEGQQASGILLSPCSTTHSINTRVTGMGHHAQLFGECWDLNSGPDACTANILLTKLTREAPRWCDGKKGCSFT